MLTDTEADVAAGIVAETGCGGLEVNSTLPPGQVGTSQIGGATDKLGKDFEDLVEDDLGELS